MKTVLLITGRVSLSSAQGIRYINLVKYLKNEFNIIHITFDKSFFYLPGVDNYQIKLCWLSNIERKILRFFYKHLNIIFPDEYRYFTGSYLNTIQTIIASYKIDTIIIGMTPFSFMKLGERLKENYPRVRLIADMSDPFSANAKYFHNKCKQTKARRFEMRYIHYFDSIIVLNDKIKDYYKSFPVKQVVTIEQGVNELFTGFSPKLKIKNELTLIYAGGFYEEFRNPGVLFQAIVDLDLNIRLHIYGGTYKRYLKISEYHFINKHDSVSQEQLIKEIEKAHVLLLIDNFYGMQVPGKTLECLAYNRPVLLIYENEDSPTLFYSKDVKGVYLVKNIKEDISKAIIKIWQEYDNCETFFDVSPFLWSKLSEHYKNIIEQD